MPRTITITLTLPDPCEDERCQLAKDHAGDHRRSWASGPNEYPGGGIGWWPRKREASHA